LWYAAEYFECFRYGGAGARVLSRRIPGENPLKLAHGMLLVAYTLVQMRQLERDRSPQQTVDYLRRTFTPPND
jgi:hypothetical protein